MKGKLYDLGNFPAAQPAEGENYIVGELYRIKNPLEYSWAFGQLDDYEGVNNEPGDSSHYIRDIAEALIGENKFPAWIYWFTGDVSGMPQIKSGDTVEFLQKKK